MKKMVGSLLMTSALLLGAMAPIAASAADTPAEGENRDGSTTATASFTAPTTPTTPVDPTDPNKPVEPKPGGDNNGANPDGGSGLSLIWAPANLNFGSHTLSVTSDEQYDATEGNDAGATATSLMPKADGTASAFTGTQVSDTRGTNAGWKLNVSSSALKLEDKSATIEGASITLPAGTLRSSGDAGVNTTANADNGAVGLGGQIQTNGTAVTVLSAAEGKGAGITVQQMNPADVFLNVNANTVQSGTYTGTLNWTLTDSVQ